MLHEYAAAEFLGVREILFTLTCILFFAYLWKWIREIQTLPPGPWGLPIVGYLPFLGKKPHETLEKLSKKYGPIFSFRLGAHLVIVLRDEDVIKEALVKQGLLFSGRPLFRNIINEELPGKGLVILEGERWKIFRRFSLSMMRDFGVGKSHLEPKIMEEIHCFLKLVENTQSKPVNVADTLQISIANIIHVFVFGQRCDHSDPQFRRLTNLLSESARKIKITNLEDFVPWLFKIPGIKHYLEKLSAAETTTIEVTNILRAKLAEQLKTRDPFGDADYVDVWYRESEKNGPQSQHFNHDELIGVIRSLIIAGMDTTTNTLLYTFWYLMKHPEIQKKLQQEIDDVIGHERSPTLDDRPRMPYTMAVMLEILRITSLLPFSITHTNLEATTLFGYHIPKRSFIFPLLWNVHQNPVKFPAPKEFHPERFLDKEGKLCNEDTLMPFSVGKRQCLGESLARAELFLYITSFFQRFTITAPANTTMNLETVYAAVLAPQPFELCAHLRKIK